MTEVDPDPNDPADDRTGPVLGDREMPDGGDPTEGGRRGEVGNAPSITSDQPADGGPGYPVGGGSVGEEDDAAPVADPGPGA